MPQKAQFAVTAEIVTAITSSQILDEVLASVAQLDHRDAAPLGVRHLRVPQGREEQTVALALWAREPHPADQDWIGSTLPLAEQPTFSRVLSASGASSPTTSTMPICRPPIESAWSGGERRAACWCHWSAQDDVIGCLELVEKRRVHRFTEEECELASTLAALSAVAIQNARLHRAEDERNRQLASLLAASRAVSSTLVVEDVLARVAKTGHRGPAGRRLLHLRVPAR